MRKKWDEYLFPAINFRGAFQVCWKMWKTRWWMKASPVLSFQVNNSTDVSSCAQLLVFVRYIHSGDNNEEFPSCKCFFFVSFIHVHMYEWVIQLCAHASRTFPSPLKKRAGFHDKNIINYMKSGNLNTWNLETLRTLQRLFSTDEVFLFHKSVRWLLKGNFLRHVFEAEGQNKVILRTENKRVHV